MKDNLFSKVYLWMFLGLMVTAISAFLVSTNEALLTAVYANNWYIGLMIIEIILVIYISRKIRDLSTNAARLSFLIFSFVNGMTLAFIFILYQLTSITMIFGLTALIFLIFSLIGFFTKLDLSKYGSIAIMGIIGIIIVSLINLFLKSSGLDLALTILGLLLFIGLIAYDTQKIKKISSYIPNEDNAAIYGALTLYLDFINIFIRLLSLFGKSRD